MREISRPRRRERGGAAHGEAVGGMRQARGGGARRPVDEV